MRKWNYLLGLMALLALASLARAADEPGDGIENFVDDQTILVVRIDVSAIDASALQGWVDAAARGDGAGKAVLRGVPQGKARVKQWVEEFKQAKGKTIYLTLNMADVLEGPEIIVPLNDAMDVNAVKVLLNETNLGRGGRRGANFGMTDKFLLFGNSRTVAAMQGRQAVDGPELAEAMKAAGDGPIRAAFIPNEDVLKIMMDGLPQLPAELGSVKTADFLESLKCGWMSIALPPAQAAKVTIQYKDADSAAKAAAGVKAVHDALQNMLEKAATRPGGLAAIVTTILPALSPTTDGDKLSIDLEGKNSNALIDPIIAMMVRQRAVSDHIRSASNLRQIGQAILLYCNDSHGSYPPDMGTLVKTEDITAAVFLNPATGHKLPENWGQMSQDEQTKWVSEDSDYVFVGAGLNQGADPSIVVVYEKEEGTAGDGINMLFADGHVEFENPEQAKQALERSKKARGGDNN